MREDFDAMLNAFYILKEESTRQYENNFAVFEDIFEMMSKLIDEIEELKKEVKILKEGESKWKMLTNTNLKKLS